MRSVIIHYHLFKNAGTTIDSILSRNFPDDAHGHIEGPYPWSTVSSEQMLEYALANPRLRVISSHQARLPLPKHPDITFLPILFVRHPIDRFASVYEFERRQPEHDLSPSANIARNGGISEFAQWVVDRGATAVCRNFHVTHLAATQHDMREARATHEDYLQALAHLKALPFFGLVESFDKALRGVQELVRPHFGELELAFTVQNFRTDRRATLGERLSLVENQLGPSLYRELLEHNSLDMLLYKEAEKMFSAHTSRQEADRPAATAKSFPRRVVQALWPRT
ncbi:hypothetical protein P3T42_002742 [Paraburkholderia sp. GAS38]|uniref:sulfotransferase family 2 domain-containing protein n=1 Tax=Paraburkholderia sp. GAS38 TaxID=3035133 RepID=UPI003D1A797D